MLRNLKTFTVGAAVLASGLAWGAQADAFWGHGSNGGYGSWGSSGGGYGSYGGGYAGYGGSYGGWGSSGGYGGSYGGGWGGGHHHRHHHRRASYGGSWGSSGGSWGGGYYGGWGSNGGSWGSSGGSWGSSGGYVVGGGAVNTAPATEPQLSPPPHPSDMPADGGLAPAPGTDLNPPDDGAPPPPTDNGAGLYRPSTSATLTVRVPADARVFVNGLATASTGNVRRYVSNGLREGYSYTYQIRAEVVRDGQTVSETQTVKLQAGDTPNVEFALNASDAEPVANQPVRTSVTLYVPADARVYLSGNETHSTGEVRTFSTTKLAAGQTWGGYAVRVEVDRNGRTLTKEETIAIRGGETRDVAIDFDAPQVASSAN